MSQTWTPYPETISHLRNGYVGEPPKRRFPVLRVQRFRRFWDRSESGYRMQMVGDDEWLSRQGDTVQIPVLDGTVTLSWETQASDSSIIYARLTYQQDRRGLLRPTSRRAPEPEARSAS